MNHDVANINQAIENLLEVGVKNLKADYPKVNKKNIMTDLVYSTFFKHSLEQTLEDLPTITINKKSKDPFILYKSACRLLIAKIKKTINE